MIKLTLRVPDELHNLIKRIAEAEDRSLNAELVHLLKHAAAAYERDHPGIK
jgi:predicted HicB family RNase H-like nuclease